MGKVAGTADSGDQGQILYAMVFNGIPLALGFSVWLREIGGRYLLWPMLEKWPSASLARDWTTWPDLPGPATSLHCDGSGKNAWADE